MAKKVDRNEHRRLRHLRIRRRMVASADRPRLSVFRSLQHIYAQIIDDTRGLTLAAASTLDPEVRAVLKSKKKAEAGQLVGQLIAKRALEKGVTKVLFDRAGYKYHGRIKALADAARQAGLQF